MGLIPQGDISYDYDSVSYNETTGTTYTETSDAGNVSAIYSPNPIYEEYTWTESLLNFINNMFVNISGLPPLLNVLVFSPLVIFGGYWLIMFIKGFIPFLN